MTKIEGTERTWNPLVGCVKPRVRVKAISKPVANLPTEIYKPIASLPLQFVGKNHRSMWWVIKPMIIHCLSDGTVWSTKELRRTIARKLGVPEHSYFENDHSWCLVELTPNQGVRGHGDKPVRKIKTGHYAIMPGHEQRLGVELPDQPTRIGEGYRCLVVRDRDYLDSNLKWIFVARRWHDNHRTKALPIIERLTAVAQHRYWSDHLLGLTETDLVLAKMFDEHGHIRLPFSAHISRNAAKKAIKNRAKAALNRRVTLRHRVPT
jgi:hypothetical protein